jgi:hypothetical protein
MTGLDHVLEYPPKSRKSRKSRKGGAACNA